MKNSIKISDLDISQNVISAMSDDFYNEIKSLQEKRKVFSADHVEWTEISNEINDLFDKLNKLRDAGDLIHSLMMKSL